MFRDLYRVHGRAAVPSLVQSEHNKAEILGQPTMQLIKSAVTTGDKSFLFSLLLLFRYQRFRAKV
jgi:hypothetical protein